MARDRVPGVPWQKVKTSPASEDADEVFRAFTSLKVVALAERTQT